MILDLSVRLKELRLEKRLRQDQLAALVGLEKSSISMYENDMRQPSYETLVRFANVFNVSVDYLLGRRDDRQLDLSGLTAAEATMISELVASMTTKNWRNFNEKNSFSHTYSVDAGNTRLCSGWRIHP